MLLEVKNIRVHYEKAEALKGVSLEVAEGNIVALVGANGAGKTTLLKTISGLRRPTTGEIWFNGKRIDGSRPNRITALGIAHVPEGRGLFPDLTVLDNLRVGAFLRTDDEAVRHDLEQIFDYFPRLKERRRQIAGSLSGGEQQMVSVARALMAKPRVLLLDEPSVGLSPLLVEELVDIIVAVSKRGVSVVLVEQNTAVALELAVWAYVIETGRIVLQGPGPELMLSPEVKKAYLGE